MNENLGRLYSKLVEMIESGQYETRSQLITSLSIIKEDPEFDTKYGINKADFANCIPLLLTKYDNYAAKKDAPISFAQEENPVNGIDINNLDEYSTNYLLDNERKNLTDEQVSLLEQRKQVFAEEAKSLTLEQSPKMKVLRPNSNLFRKSAFIDLLILSILSFGFSLGVLIYILFRTSI